MAGIIEGVAALGSGALLHDLPETLTVAGNGWIETRVEIGLEIDQRCKAAFGGAVSFGGALVLAEAVMNL